MLHGGASRRWPATWPGATSLPWNGFLPEAADVFDRFHLTKLYNEKLAALRRELYREARDVLHKQVLKRTRWLLLKHEGNLDASRREPERLQEALRLNASLATAYYLKEDLRR